jgi:hypothetical protein
MNSEDRAMPMMPVPLPLPGRFNEQSPFSDVLIVREVGDGTAWEQANIDGAWMDRVSGRRPDAIDELPAGASAVLAVRHGGSTRYVRVALNMPQGDSDYDCLLWDATAGAWEAAATTTATVVTDYRFDETTGKLQKKTRVLRVISAETESDWTDGHEPGTCS